MAKSKVIGGKQAAKAWRKLGKEGQNAFAGALYLEGLYVLRKAISNAPVMTGRLRGSHYAELPSRTRMAMRIGFGTKYAWSVHEGIKRRIKDQPRRVQRAFWAGKWKATTTTSGRSGGSVTTYKSTGRKEKWTQAGRGGAMVSLLWDTSVVGGPKFLENASLETRNGRMARVRRRFLALLAKKQGVPAGGSVPVAPKE